MRQLAMAVSAALVLFLISPAFAQPFADTPPNHWAYDAIAELAAKGLIEGYPDGTFKGDRAMTRYEMAMVVARLLARIESIQVPAPAGPAPGGMMVSKEDIDNIMRLVNEFRAELAAKNVRLTAVEEELNAIKAKQDNVRFTGWMRVRYNENRSGSTPGLGGNAQAFKTDSSANAQLGKVVERLKLAFDGSVAPDVHFIGALLMTDNPFNSGLAGSTAPAWILTNVDNAFFDWKNAFGAPLEVWLGRFGGSSVGASYPVQFGPFGLIMNTGGDTWEDSTADSGLNVADGLRLGFHKPDWADLQIQGVIIRVQNTATMYFGGEDAYGVDANIKVIEGLRVGADYVGNSIAGAATTVGSASYHLYGPGGGAMNPATTNCPTLTVGLLSGIDCPALGNGFGAYAQWDIVPGIHLDGEWAQWSDSVHSSSDSGWQVNVHWDLGSLLGVGHGLGLDTGYANFGTNFYPPYGAAEADIAMNDTLYPGNTQAWLFGLSFNPADNWNIFGHYLTGNTVTPNESESEYDVGVKYTFAPNASILLYVNSLTLASVNQFLLYRAEFNYSY